MKFESFQAFLNMDGQGLFVWAAYGITCIVLLLNVWWPGMTLARIIRTGKAQVAGRQPGAGVEGS